jgi:selenophosphate synthetase-related protein
MDKFVVTAILAGLIATATLLAPKHRTVAEVDEASMAAPSDIDALRWIRIGNPFEAN